MSSSGVWRGVLITLGVLLVAGVAVVVSVPGLMDRYLHGESEAPAQPADPQPQPTLVCLGHVDVEGGLTPLVPATAGRVVSIAVEEGRHVEAGAELLRLDDTAARLQVAEAEQAVRSARSQLAEAERLPDQLAADRRRQEAAIAAAVARRDAARKLVELNRSKQDLNVATAEQVAISESQLAEAEAALTAERLRLEELDRRDTDPQLEQAAAALKRAEVVQEQARQQVEALVLRAPAAGVVLRLAVGPGEVIGPQAGPAVLFAADRPRVVRARVEQEFADRIEVGLRATVGDDGCPDCWTGEIVRIADWFSSPRPLVGRSQTDGDTRTLEFVVRLDESKNPPRIGREVHVRVQLVEQSPRQE
jgi:multidrug resistance efflux pump